MGGNTVKVVTLNSLKLFLDYLKKNFKAPFAERDGDGNIIKDTYLHATDKVDFAKKADVSDSCTGKSASAEKAEQLSEAREVRLTGGVSGAGMFDGSGDLVIETTIGDVTEGINELRSETNTKVSDLDTKISGLDTKLDDTKKELAASQETEISKTNAVISTNDVAASPCYYSEDTRWKADGRTTLKSPNILWMNVNNLGYRMSEAVSLPVSEASSWDSTETDYTTGANRAGKDFYIFACIDSDRNLLFKLSANSTVPSGYTAYNSRKIGGFHCLCADVGTISGHALTGYVAGDILPASVWDCEHRPVSSPEGMVYSEECDKWFDIYLTSYTGTVTDGTLQVQSVYGATCADGTSGVKFHWYTFAKYYKKARKMMMNQEEFMSISTGSNQGTNIAGSADVGKTGGYKDTAGRRMISNIGCEDCCGNLWQWGIETGDTNTGNSWSNAYGGSDDSSQLGQGYQVPSRVLFGGPWDDGAYCGSRGSHWHPVPLTLTAAIGSRACAEPLHRSA